jgi:hypothetical protein
MGTNSLEPSFSKYDSPEFYHEKVQNVNELHERIITAPENVTNENLANSW